MTTQAEKANRFEQLHQQPGAFVIPNPWDVGSARVLESFGFECLATTSSGYAQALGKNDGDMSLDDKLEHCRALSDATSIPISADLEYGFADNPKEVANTITRVARAGIVGGSVEDYSTNPDKPIYEFNHAVERVAAAVEAARALPFPFIVTARAEGLLRVERNMDDIIVRLQAFEAAGADVVYAPALRTLDEVRQVTAEVTRPVNVLVTMMQPGVTLDQLADAGAKRISVGGGLSRVAFGSLIEAATEMTERGTFEWRSRIAEAKSLNSRLAR